MDQLNIINILERNKEEKCLIETLDYFEKNKKNVLTKRGIYIYGSPGSGKTYFVKSILKKLNYDIIGYDAGDVRNKNIIENITKNNMSDTNIISMFKKESKGIVLEITRNITNRCSWNITWISSSVINRGYTTSSSDWRTI